MASIAFMSPAANTGIMDFKSAPTENGASGAQITKALKRSSAMSMAWLMPSNTSRLMARFLLVFSTTKTSLSKVKAWMASVLNTVSPNALADSPNNFAGAYWRWYTSKSLRPSACKVVKFKLPASACTPSRPSLTQAGNAALLKVLPAAMSSLIHSTTCFQPAACQISNGPMSQPKPQRMAKSMSRALWAMSLACTAM